MRADAMRSSQDEYHFSNYRFIVHGLPPVAIRPLTDSELAAEALYELQCKQDQERIYNGYYFEHDRPRVETFVQRINQRLPLFSIKSELFSFNKKSALEKKFLQLLAKHSDIKYAEPKLCADIVLLLDKISCSLTAAIVRERLIEDQQSNLNPSFFPKFGMSAEEICKLLTTRHGDPVRERSTTHQRVSSVWDELRDELIQQDEQAAAAKRAQAKPAASTQETTTRMVNTI